MNPLSAPSLATLGWRRRAACLALALVPLAACDASARLGAPRTGYSTETAPDGIIDRALVGTWKRVLLFTSAAGRLQRVETTWTFRPDGSAIRTVEVLDLDLAIADRFVSRADWRVSGHTLVIDWRPPISGRLLLPYRVAADGETAIIGDDPYVRVL